MFTLTSLHLYPSLPTLLISLTHGYLCDATWPFPFFILFFYFFISFIFFVFLYALASNVQCAHNTYTHATAKVASRKNNIHRTGAVGWKECRLGGFPSDYFLPLLVSFSITTRFHLFGLIRFWYYSYRVKFDYHTFTDEFQN